MRALVVTNMYPSAGDPVRGRFVRDQVEALARMPDVELELFAFGHGGASPYVKAVRDIARRYRRAHFDVVHAHFGLTAWPSLAAPGAAHVVTLHGTDVVHPRSRAITLAAIPFVDLVAPVSASLAGLLPSRLTRGKTAILPCGVDVGRFKSIPRPSARRALGLGDASRYLLFAADPTRPEKRYDRAVEVAREVHDPGGGSHQVQLLTLGNVAPEQVPAWVNAVDAVLVTSERESLGLVVLEALACGVPVLATPVGIAPEVLPSVPGTYCGPFDAGAWAATVRQLLDDPDPRVDGRAAAERYSVERMAARVLDAWRTLS